MSGLSGISDAAVVNNGDGGYRNPGRYGTFLRVGRGSVLDVVLCIPVGGTDAAVLMPCRVASSGVESSCCDERLTEGDEDCKILSEK